MTIQEVISTRGATDIDWWTPPNGDSLIRILPIAHDSSELFWVETENPNSDGRPNQRRFLANIFDYSDKHTKVWAISERYLERILEYMADPNVGDIVDLRRGRDILIERRVTSGPFTELIITPARRRSIFNGRGRLRTEYNDLIHAAAEYRARRNHLERYKALARERGTIIDREELKEIKISKPLALRKFNWG
jgi:hypothetical protein